MEWYPKWADHFNVVKARGVSVEYVNVLSPVTMPKFCLGDRIDIGKILSAYTIPGPLKSLVPPFNFEFNFDASRPDIPMKVHTKLAAMQGGKEPLRLTFKASTEETKREIGLDKIFQEANIAHDLILLEFEAYFTEQAKLSFEPV